MQTINLTETSEIRVQKKVYKGKEYLDVRKWFLDPETREWTPTTKGINMPLDLVPRVHEAMVLESGAEKKEDAPAPEAPAAPTVVNDLDIGF